MNNLTNELTNEDYRNILVLISKANITGQDAVAVALLLQKIQGLLTKEEDDKSIKEPKNR